MAKATFHFPRGFLWGTSTSSHQVEGQNTNNQWWAWEQTPGKIRDGDVSGPACDWWGGRWREDFDRAAEAGQNAHRFSVEWSRIQPVPDRWDESALDRYCEMARGLLHREMTPLVTLHHFSDPLWLAERGGWENESVVDLFAAYVHKVVEALRENVSLWVTINEPNVYTASGYVLGDFPPGEKDLKKAMAVYTNMVRGHAAAYRVIKELQPTARVGVALHFRGFRPARTWNPLDRWLAGLIHQMMNDFFPRALATGVLRFPFRSQRLPEIKGTQDFLGLNYYTEELVALKPLSFNPKAPEQILNHRYYAPGAELSDGGFIANVPEGMARALKWCKSFDLPVIVTENGINDSRGVLRPRYLVQHLHQVWRELNLGIPIKGYFHWSLVDNFEWERGWAQRFGLWELDRETLARRKRPGVDLYAAICRENAISSETVGKYTPELAPLLFPD